MLVISSASNKAALGENRSCSMYITWLHNALFDVVSELQAEAQKQGNQLSVVSTAIILLKLHEATFHMCVSAASEGVCKHL